MFQQRHQCHCFFSCRKILLYLPICRRYILRHISEPYKRSLVCNRHRHPLEQFLVSYLIQIHILYAVWCYPDRREGRRYPPQSLLSRHWLSACEVGTLRGPCHPCRCVPSRCNTCQSYSINTMVC